jgi:hypothetical protein
MISRVLYRVFLLWPLEGFLFLWHYIKKILYTVFLLWPVMGSLLFWYFLKKPLKQSKINLCISLAVYSTLTLAMIFVDPKYLLIYLIIICIFFKLNKGK